MLRAHCSILFAWILLITSSSFGRDSHQKLNPQEVFINGQRVYLDNTISETPLSYEQQSFIKQMSLTFVTYFLDKKITNIGGLDLQRILEDSKSVNYFIITKGYTIAQGRIGHMYDVVEKKVRLSPITIKKNKSLEESVAQIALIFHETLGALGYADEDYELSATIAALYLAGKENRHVFLGSQNQIKPLTFDEVKQIAQKLTFNITRRTTNPKEQKNNRESSTFEQILLAGGVTEGGGGGDLTAILAKTSLIERLMREKANDNFINYSIYSTQFETYNEHRCPQLDFNEFKELIKIQNVSTKVKFKIPNACAGVFAPNFYPQYHLIQGVIDTLIVESKKSF